MSAMPGAAALTAASSGSRSTCEATKASAPAAHHDQRAAYLRRSTSVSVTTLATTTASCAEEARSGVGIRCFAACVAPQCMN